MRCPQISKSGSVPVVAAEARSSPSDPGRSNAHHDVASALTFRGSPSEQSFIMEHDLWRQQFEEIKAKENGHGNGDGSNGHSYSRGNVYEARSRRFTILPSVLAKVHGQGHDRSAADSGLYES